MKMTMNRKLRLATVIRREIGDRRASKQFAEAFSGFTDLSGAGWAWWVFGEIS